MPARVIVRLPNWLGDTVMAVAALRAPRAGWPGAPILAPGPWGQIIAGTKLGGGAGGRLLDDATARTHGPRVGVHLGADYGPSKLWPFARIVEGCRALAAAGLTPVLLGSPRDAALADAVAAATEAASLVGRDDPTVLPALLRELDALGAGDTGVTPPAAARGPHVLPLV